MHWRRTRAGAVALAVLFAACDSPFDTRPPAELVAVGGLDQSAEVGSELPDVVLVRLQDASGRPVSAQQITWDVVSGGGRVDPATSWTDADGVASTTWTLGPAAGDQVLRAAGPRQLQVDVGASADAGPAIEIAADRPSLSLGALGLSATLSATGIDRFGNPIPAAAITWSSSDTTVATVTTAGLVQARSAGQTLVIATSGPVADTVVVLVSEVVGIALIEPAVLVPGSTAFVHGVHFAPLAADNVVTVNGVSAVVTAATPTQLTLAMPQASLLPCVPTAPVPVVVSVGGVSAVREHPLRIASPLELAVGQSARFDTAAESACTELHDDGGRYVLSVFHIGRTASATSAFRLTGAPGAVPSSPPLVLAAGPLDSPVGLSPHRRHGQAPPPPRATERERRAHQQHARLLDENRRVIERHGAPRRREQAAAGMPGGGTGTLDAQTRASLPDTGSIIQVRVPDIRQSLCTDYFNVDARVVHVGARAIILEDTLAPLRGQVDDALTQIGVEFDTLMYPILLDFFGDPLAFDAHTNDDGRLYMLFSQRVNEMGGVLGFVWSADFYDPADINCPAANQAEIFYAVAPTNTDDNLDFSSLRGWRHQMRTVVIHEAKHIASYAERFARSASTFEVSWLEEATAMISMELWARHVFGFGQHEKLTYDVSVHCEVHPESCGGTPRAVQSHFVWLYRYLANSEDFTPLRSPTDNVAAFYGSGWSLVRWVLDHYGGSEQQLLRAMNTNPTLSGVGNLEVAAGMLFGEMIGDWSLALATDDWPVPFTAESPRLTMPSWNLRSMFAGLNSDFPSSIPEPFPVAAHQVGFGEFSVETQLRAGSASFFELSGTQAAPQMLQLTGADGGALPGNLRLAIVRVE